MHSKSELRWRTHLNQGKLSRSTKVKTFLTWNNSKRNHKETILYKEISLYRDYILFREIEQKMAKTLLKLLVTDAHPNEGYSRWYLYIGEVQSLFGENQEGTLRN